MTEMRPVDFKKIQEKISFVKILEYYEIELREEGKSLVGQGPLCTNEQSASPAGFFICSPNTTPIGHILSTTSCGLLVFRGARADQVDSIRE
jgi:hypothetical protein